MNEFIIKHGFISKANSLIEGNLTITEILHETTNVNKILVSNNGLLNYRTGPEILSDIGGVAGINYWTKSGNNLYYNDGNVGIGTTSPQYKLDISGSARFTGTVIGADATLLTEFVTLSQLNSSVASANTLVAVDASNISNVIFTKYDGTTITESFGHHHSEYALISWVNDNFIDNSETLWIETGSEIAPRNNSDTVKTKGSFFVYNSDDPFNMSSSHLEATQLSIQDPSGKGTQLTQSALTTTGNGPLHISASGGVYIDGLNSSISDSVLVESHGLIGNRSVSDILSNTVPSNRRLTISGDTLVTVVPATAQDLSADRTWAISHNTISTSPTNGAILSWGDNVLTSLGNDGHGHITSYTLNALPDNPVSDTAYGSSWSGVTDVAPSKNAVYNKIELLASSNLWTRNSSGHYTYLTNSGDTVGIGTSTPIFDLDVAGTVRAVSGYIVGDNTQTSQNQGSYLVADQGGGDTGMELSGIDGNESVGLWTQDSLRLFIDSQGFVGIGTGTTPEMPFHVKTSNGEVAKFEDTDIPGYVKIQSDIIGDDFGIIGKSSDSSGEWVMVGVSNEKVYLGDGVVWVDNTTVKVSIGTSTISSERLNVEGSIALNGTKIITLPDQTNFTGSLIYGTGGNSLSHTSGTQGWKDTLIGIGAGFSLTTGNYNTAIGSSAGYSSITGSNWTAIGNEAGFKATSNAWTAVGTYSASIATTGYEWVALGYSSAHLVTTGSLWTAIGAESGYSNDDGDRWVSLGYIAARYLLDGTTEATSFSDSVYVGANTRVSAVGVENENVFGYAAKGSGSNTVTIGNDAIVNTYINGILTANMGIETPIDVVNVDLTLTDSHHTIIIDSDTNRTITLPDASLYPGIIYVIKTINTGRSHTIQVTGGIGNDIFTDNSVTAISLSSPGETIVLQSDGASRYYAWGSSKF